MQRVLPFLVFAVVLGVALIFGATVPETFVNFQPLGALFFCGMAFFGWRGIILPAVAWLVSYPITSAIQGYDLGFHLVTPAIGFLVMVTLAHRFQRKGRGQIFLGSLLGAIAFYLVTNTLTWLGDPLYATKSFSTWFQALTVGHPQFGIPTWMFFRNAFLAQGLFSGIFILATCQIPQIWARKLPQSAS